MKVEKLRADELRAGSDCKQESSRQAKRANRCPGGKPPSLSIPRQLPPLRTGVSGGGEKTTGGLSDKSTASSLTTSVAMPSPGDWRHSPKDGEVCQASCRRTHPAARACAARWRPKLGAPAAFVTTLD